MRHYQGIGIGLLGIILTTACAGTAERIDLKVPMSGGADENVVAMSSPTIAILPFEDNRTDRSHLGTRHHLWGGESHFSLTGTTLSEATAEALAEFLKGKGWNAAVAKSNEPVGADMTIIGKLEDVGVDARSGIGHTILNAKSRMVVQVKNHADGSQVRETLTSVGSNQIFWFDPEDAQELLNDLYKRNFEKFVTDTRLEGKILKLR